MPYPRLPGQAALEWLPPLTTVLWFAPKQIYVNQNIINAVRTQTNVVENKSSDKESLWTQPYFRIIRTKPHFSGTHFDDKFIALGVTFALSDMLLSFAWFRFAKCKPCDNDVVLKLYKLMADNFRHNTMRTFFHFQPCREYCSFVHILIR